MKRTLASTSLALVALALLPTIGVAEEPAAEPNPWRALAVRGVVEALPDAQPDWLPVARGHELAPQTVVRTGKRGRATLSRSDDVLIIEPQSRLALPEELKAELTEIRQGSGSVLYEIDSREQGEFRVVTPYLVAGVKGTAFLVSITDRYAAVTVREGVVEVERPDFGDRLELRAGDTALVDFDYDSRMELVSRDARGEARDEALRFADTESRKVDRVLNRKGADRRSRRDLIGDATRRGGVDLLDDGVRRADSFKLEAEKEDAQGEQEREQVDDDRDEDRRSTEPAPDDEQGLPDPADPDDGEGKDQDDPEQMDPADGTEDGRDR